LIAVIDPEAQKVVWSLTGQWAYQHEPDLLDNGNILLFDNEGNGDYSKVIEFDPRSQETRWAFYGNAENDFLSKTMGSQQRLPNGNTLITESNAGRVREVTHEGREVWRFQSPHLDPDGADPGSLRAARICEMQRISPGDRNLSWLRQSTAVRQKETSQGIAPSDALSGDMADRALMRTSEMELQASPSDTHLLNPEGFRHGEGR
jgi:hypothetical protein